MKHIIYFIFVIAFFLAPVESLATTTGISVNHSSGAVIVGVSTANCKSGNKGALRYNSVTNAINFCNNTPAWTSLLQQQASGSAPPVGSGFFVLSYGTWNGNLGGFAGADSKCVTDLQTNTGWRDYATANSRGLVNSSHIHAFLAGYSNKGVDLVASTTYYFSNAANSSAGGASFTTNGSGAGPQDSANWAAANYFGGSYFYWTGRDQNTDSLWNLKAAVPCCNTQCTDWSSSSSALSVFSGASSATNGFRWYMLGLKTCDHVYHLICYVNP